MKVISLDPTIIEPKSPANSNAAQWYIRERERNQISFPTVSISELINKGQKPNITWRTIK